MRVLFVTPGFPAPPTTGGSQRAFHLLRLLVRRHEVHLVSLVSGAPASEAVATVQSWCSGITLAPVAARRLSDRLRDLAATRHPDMARRLTSSAAVEDLKRLLRDQRFDVVQVEGLEACADLLSALAVTPEPHPALVLDAFNAEYLLQRRAFLVDVRQPERWPAAAYSLVQWQKLARFERSVCRRAAAVVAVSDEDRRALLTLDRDLRVVVAPHGVDTERYHPPVASRRHRGDHTLLFTGTMDFRPNVDAVTWFCSQILPIVRREVPDVQVTIAGRNPTAAVREMAGPGVTVTGPVADDVPFFESATAFVLPMRYGGGVRLKLLQALATELPVISTSLGADGMAVRTGEHLLLADRPEQFAAAVVQVLQQPEFGAVLGAAGRRLVETRYSWDATGEIIDELYGELGTGATGRRQRRYNPEAIG